MAESNPQLCKISDNLEKFSADVSDPIKSHSSRKYPTINLFQSLEASPVPIINEFSDQSQQSRVKPRNSATKTTTTAHRLRRQGSPADATNAGLEFDTCLENGGLLSDNATAFALHQSTNNMHMANLTLKTRVSRLICDNQQLNERVDKISQKNHALAIERERLLTTLQNTSAIIQSTVGTLSQEHEAVSELDPLCFQLEAAKTKSLDLGSDSDTNSDSLERSTKSTIQEFDNLLSALQGREKRVKQTNEKVTTVKTTGNQDNSSQFDVIVNWLNNKSVQQSRISYGNSEGDSSTTKSIGDEEYTSKSISHNLQVDKSNEEQIFGNLPTNNNFSEKLEKHESPSTPKGSQVIPHAGGDQKNCDANLQENNAQSGKSSREDSIKLVIEEMPPSKTCSSLKDDENKEHSTENANFGESTMWLGSDSCLKSPAKEKTEFLQNWLDDLKTRTQKFKESRRGSTATSTQPANGKPSDEEHEEFISLCNTMIDRMDSMILKTTRCHNNQRNSQSGQIMKFLMNETKDLKLKYSSRKKKTKIRKHQSKKLRHSNKQHNYYRHNTADSTSSSDFSWTDLAELEKDRTSLRTFQKCLANLEEMNMRRTNNALTQTLIIKALRKLMAKQCSSMTKQSEETGTEESEDSLDASSEKNTDNDGDDERIDTDHETDQVNEVDQQNGQQILDADNRPETRGQMYDVIDNVSKSIIYQDLGDDFTQSVGEHTTCFHQSQLNSPPELLTKLDITQRKREHTFDPSTSKIYHELKRLEMEQQKPIPVCWFYLALILTLSQSGILRLLKYLCRILLKF